MVFAAASYSDVVCDRPCNNKPGFGSVHRMGDARRMATAMATFLRHCHNAGFYFGAHCIYKSRLRNVEPGTAWLVAAQRFSRSWHRVHRCISFGRYCSLSQAKQVIVRCRKAIDACHSCARNLAIGVSARCAKNSDKYMFQIFGPKIIKSSLGIDR